MSRTTADTVVVGAGPAGASVAIRLARAGREVVLIDRTPPPRDKLCGEFLSPESAWDLAGLGLMPELDELDAPTVDRARFTAPSGRSAAFALPGPGRGLSRRALDALLWEAALGAGVDVRVGEVVAVHPRAGGVELALLDETTLHARRVVGAHGRHRRLDRALGLEDERAPLKAYAAFKRHHFADRETSSALDGHVEIHVFDGGYCGMSHVEGGVVNVCALVRTDWLKAQPDRTWPALLHAMAQRQPCLRERAGGLTPHPDRDTIRIGAIDLVGRRATRGPALVVGDAAAVIAPLAGDGQAMALSGGRRLAETILAHPSRTPAATIAAAWGRTFEREYAPRLRVARGLQQVLERPWAAELLVRAGAFSPALGRGLAVLTRERDPGLMPTDPGP